MARLIPSFVPPIFQNQKYFIYPERNSLSNTTPGNLVENKSSSIYTVQIVATYNQMKITKIEKKETRL